MSVISEDLRDRLPYAVWDVKAIGHKDLECAFKHIVKVCETEREFQESVEHLWSILTDDGKFDLLVISDSDWYMSYVDELWDWAQETFMPECPQLKCFKEAIERR